MSCNFVILVFPLVILIIIILITDNHHHYLLHHQVGATILVFATLPFSLCCVIKIVKEYERAVIFR